MILRKLFLLSILAISSSTALFSKDQPVLKKIKFAHNWVPEPEFGGFYAAKILGLYEKAGFDVEIIPGGAGSPTVQMLASKQVDFAVTSGGEVLVSRSKGANVVAIYNIYETSPLCLMAHQSRRAKSMADLFNGGTLAIQKGSAFYDVLEKKFGFSKITVVPYTGGVAQFLRDPMFMQQGFITSEPILARNQGSDPQSFLLADIGYNPYIGVVAVNGEYMKQNEATVKSFVNVIREGWEHYQKDPKATNELMASLNKAMDIKTFHAGAEAQRTFVQKDKKIPLGRMTEARWNASQQHLLEFKIIPKPIDVKDAFRNLE